MLNSLPPTTLRYTFIFGLVLLSCSLVAPRGWADGDNAEASETAPREEPKRFVVNPSPGLQASFMEALQRRPFMRWIVPSMEGRMELRVSGRAPDVLDVPGTIQITPRLLPLEDIDAERWAGLPLTVDGTTLHFGGQTYDDPRHCLTFRLPAAQPAQWMVLCHGLDALARATDRLLIQESGVRWWRPQSGADYRIQEHEHAERSGFWHFGADGTAQPDPDERDDFSTRRRHYAELTVMPGQGMRLWIAPERAALDSTRRLQAQLAAAAERIRAALGMTSMAPVDVVVESDYALQGRHLGVLGAAVLGHRLLPMEDVDRPTPRTRDDSLHDDSLHIVEHRDDLPFYRHGLARLLLRRAGHALPHWFEQGAALWLTGDWYGRPYGAWLEPLVAGDVLPTVDQLLAEAPQDNSSAVLWPPVAAALIDRLPGTTLAEKLAAASSVGDSRKPLEQLLEAVAETARSEIASQPSTTSYRPKPLGDFQAGVSFAMANGLDIGYHAPGVDDALRHMQSLGSNSVSIMPFAYQAEATRPTLRFLNRRPSSETDIGAVHAARRARALGLRVLWKPHIWLSTDSWAGDIVMASEADWTTWFGEFRRYIMHHAVLAQWTDSELFSIGVELGQTVHRESQWRHLIDAVRGVYDGPLTYSGNWWADYDQVPFWDALDAVGVDAYFPLADHVTASDAELRDGARRAVDELRRFSLRHDRPVLLTETGFAALRGTWIKPHVEEGDLSLDHQRRAYDALLSTLGHPEWLRGIYVWKAFSHAEAEGGERPDFRFIGRPAEASIQRYFESNPDFESPTAATP